MPEPLSEQQINDALKNLPGWTHEAGKLKRHLEFGSFKEALSFIVRLGLHAEQQEHHPELFNVYNKVDIALATHDAGGKVTEKDVKLAQTIHEFNWRAPQ